MCVKPVYVKGIMVACGKCVECLIQRSEEWSYRIMQEASLYKDNCFITLTYNEDNLPDGASLKRADLQKFIKRLRKKLSANAIKIRYFYCGEYGKKGNRPHYHIIVFNWKPPDMYFFCYDNKKTPLYRSPIIEDLWKYGFSSVGEVTQDSAKYCAKYLNKDLSVKGQQKSFIGMSTKPCIGFNAIKEKWLDSDNMYIDGKVIKIPRAYIKQLAKNKDNWDKIDNIKIKRLFNSGCITTQQFYLSHLDGTRSPVLIYENEEIMQSRIDLFNYKNREKKKKYNIIEKDLKNLVKSLDNKKDM